MQISILHALRRLMFKKAYFCFTLNCPKLLDQKYLFSCTNSHIVTPMIKKFGLNIWLVVYKQTSNIWVYLIQSCSKEYVQYFEFFFFLIRFPTRWWCYNTKILPNNGLAFPIQFHKHLLSVCYVLDTNDIQTSDFGGARIHPSFLSGEYSFHYTQHMHFRKQCLLFLTRSLWETLYLKNCKRKNFKEFIQEDNSLIRM